MRAVNLIPADQRGGMARGPVRSGGGAYAVLVLLAGLAILALLYGTARRQVSSRRAQAASVAAQFQEIESQAAQLAPYTAFAAMREQRVQTVLGLVDSRFDWAHALHELGRVIPRDASISSLTGTIGSQSSAGGSSGAHNGSAATGSAATSSGATGSAGTSATPPGSVPTFTLSGCATSQTEVALTLDRLRLIDGVSEVTLTSSTKSTAGGGGAGSGGCAASDPVFTVQVVFAPLPASSVVSSAVSSGQRAATISTGGPR
jgi:hypothetical protein